MCRLNHHTRGTLAFSAKIHSISIGFDRVLADKPNYYFKHMSRVDFCAVIVAPLNARVLCDITSTALSFAPSPQFASIAQPSPLLSPLSTPTHHENTWTIFTKCQKPLRWVRLSSIILVKKKHKSKRQHIKKLVLLCVCRWTCVIFFAPLVLFAL